MRSFKTVSLVLAASIAVTFTPSTVAAIETATTTLGVTHRHLRVQHNGVDDHDGEVARDAGIPGYGKAAQPPQTPSAPALAATVPASAPGSASAVFPVVAASAPAPPSQATSVNVTPGSVNTTVNITPGTPTTPINGVSGPATASAPQSVVAQPRPATAPAPTTAAKPATSGLEFDNLNPLTLVATLAHQAHGMILGHTGTLPSSYMQGPSGDGGHGH